MILLRPKPLGGSIVLLLLNRVDAQPSAAHTLAMNTPPKLWCLGVAARAATVNAYEEALEPFCDAISWISTDEAGDLEDGTEGAPKGDWRIEGISRIKPDAARLAQAMVAVAEAFDEPAPVVTVNPVVHRDWVVEGLRMFPPIDVERYFIYGSHYRNSPPPGRIGIVLNPGRAFGSGDHATTMGCLRALDGLARTHTFHKMLDMGCGSGILAIAMARTWPGSMNGRIMAADNDSRAVPVAAENVRRNGVASRVRTLVGNGYASEKIIKTGPYDLIVSNILANPLRRMAKDLGRNLRRAEKGGGIVVLSGLLIRDARRVTAAHRSHGLRLLRCYDIKGWRTLVLRRPGR